MQGKEPSASAKGLIQVLVVAIGLPMAIAVFLDKPAWAVVFFLFAFPGVIAVAALAKAGEMKDAARWPTAKGRITRSELADAVHQERKVQVPRIEYEFRVGTHTKVGKRVNLAELVAGVQAKEAIARYPLGAEVEVYYNPGDPSEAVLEVEAPPEIMRAAWGLVAAMTAAIVLGAWYFLVR